MSGRDAVIAADIRTGSSATPEFLDVDRAARDLLSVLPIDRSIVMAKQKTNVSLPAKKPRPRPVTKDELRAELEPYVTKDYLDEKFDEKLAPYVTKDYLEKKFDEKLAPYATQLDLANMRAELVAELASKRDLIDMTERLRREFQEDLARHTNTILDAVRVMIRAIDDKYTDLPPRVTALEEHVGK